MTRELWVNRGGRLLTPVSRILEILQVAVRREGTWGRVGSEPEHYFPAKESWTSGFCILETPSFTQEIRRCPGAREAAEQMY